jgi:hypothetical protein
MLHETKDLVGPTYRKLTLHKRSNPGIGRIFSGLCCCSHIFVLLSSARISPQMLSAGSLQGTHEFPNLW